MVEMKITRYFVLIGVCLALAVMSGCDILRNRALQATEVAEPTATPVAMPTALSVQTRVESQTCLVAEKVTIQTDKPQGDLMAWSPNNDDLALVQPVNQYSGWYIGDILVFDAIEAKEEFTSEDQAVFGDLTWSPDGSQLAYVELIQREGIYTIKIVNLTDGLSVDVFGDVDQARTDDFASLKGIRSWQNASDLEVMSYCGPDCVRVYQYNPISEALIIEEEVRQNEDLSLITDSEFVSPDGNWMVTLDEKDNTWLTSKRENKVSLLMVTLVVEEVKWSADSRYLAIRTAESVKIYETGCTQE